MREHYSVYPACLALPAVIISYTIGKEDRVNVYEEIATDEDSWFCRFVHGAVGEKNNVILKSVLKTAQYSRIQGFKAKENMLSYINPCMVFRSVGPVFII